MLGLAVFASRQRLYDNVERLPDVIKLQMSIRACITGCKGHGEHIQRPPVDIR